MLIVPDMFINFLRQIFSPNPSDILMHYFKNRKEPDLGSTADYQFNNKTKISPKNSLGMANQTNMNR